jgi:cyclic pyranopterin phosphate synthase
MKKFTHLDEKGKATMVDVTAKESTLRQATAQGTVIMRTDTFERIMAGGMEKGDVLGVANVAGIMAAKHTAEIIPLCHPLNITHVEITFNPIAEHHRIDIAAQVQLTGKTGVEMEALVAVTTAALTVYDMCKAVDKRILIGNIHLLSKKGGRSGQFTW